MYNVSRERKRERERGRERERMIMRERDQTSWSLCTASKVWEAPVKVPVGSQVSSLLTVLSILSSYFSTSMFWWLVDTSQIITKIFLNFSSTNNKD